MSESERTRYGLNAAPQRAIAVVGLACRLPGAPDPDGLWRLLRDGDSAVRPAPADRPRSAAASAEDGSEGGVPRWGGLLDEVDRFDAGFFGVSPREADAMDPQQRLVLELAWEALEDARILPERLRSTSAGVFIGAAHDDYATLLHALGPEAVTHQSFTGTHRALVANRLSYLLGLRGPSLTLDSAQSSSLVAVHLACESLRSGDSDIALAGGVNLHLAPESSLYPHRFGALSPDGRCYTFDARANGFVRGEGGGLVLLKPLDRALADGDPVRAVIRGSAVNNDGGGDTLTAPDPRAQEDVIRRALRNAGTAPHDIQYVELHGTGTPVGDPVEAAALGAALGEGRPSDEPLRVGSLKTNVGHLEGAAGIAGLVKTVLALQHRELPPSLNYLTPHPDIPLDALRLRVQNTSSPWPRPAAPLIAGVSAFGMGGTNAHVVVEEAPVLSEAGSGHVDVAPVFVGGGVVPWVVSGRGGEGLAGQAGRLASVVGEARQVDVAWSLAATRTAFENRAVVLGGESAELVGGLHVLAAGGVVGSGVVRGAVVGGGDRVVFVFPGQGAQWVGMGRELWGVSPVFAASMEACERALAPFVGWSLSEVVRGGGELVDVDVVQPVSWAVMVSLAAVWAACGVVPSVVVGHSQGEIAAAVVAGGLSLEDGARVVALRSRAIRAIAGRGGMVSVPLPLAEVEELLTSWSGRVDVAAVNGPASVVVAGDADALDELMAHCGAEEIRARRVPVDYASHTWHVEAIEEELARVLAAVEPRTGQVPFFSTTEAEVVDTARLDGGYWYRNLRRRVCFADAVQGLVEQGYGAFVEVSSHPVLGMAVQEAAPDAVVVGTLRRDKGDAHRVLTSLAEAWVRGIPVDWTAVLAGQDARTVALPTYAFQRRRHWFDGGATRGLALEADVVPVPERRNDWVQRVRAHAAAVLGHTAAGDVDSTLTFKALGFDSATSVELRNRLVGDTGLSLPASVLFDHPTPQALALHLRGLLDGGSAPALEASVNPTPATEDEPIAIVAMGCRLPGGIRTPEELWELLSAGGDTVSGFPTDRGWDLGHLYDPDPEQHGTTYARSGSFLYGAGDFDPGFFGISPREAVAMDPQQRLLLEASWEALERAGIDPETLRERDGGVFVGIMQQEYGPGLHRAPDSVDGYLLTGTSSSVASGRIAYVLGLRGQAVTVDTACSSSLVALHLAVQALRAGECSFALAGGATVMAEPGIFVEFSRQRGLAPDGRCKPFAAGADGTGWGEGVGVLLLERLSDARRNGHPVLAVVRGSAVNQDGASNGLTAPNGPAQERVIRAALGKAGLSAADVDAVEAHGTGTMLGDPIEAQALLATYGQGRDPERPLWLGSLKSNIGHTQAAAGVVGVMKMVLAMRNGVLPRTLHVDEPTPHVDWSAGAVSLLTEAVEWPSGEGRPRRAGVSSFGISGTNAHVVLEEAPVLSEAGSGHADVAPVFVGGGVVPWVVSGRGGEGLAGQAGRLASFVESAGDEVRPVDVGWSLAATRTAFENRAVVLGAEPDDLILAVKGLMADDGASPSSVVRGRTARAAGDVVFVFPGQGAQWVGMGRELWGVSPVFAASMEACERALAPFVGWSLSEVVRGGGELVDVDVVQPVSWAVMVSLAAVWAACGVVPSVVVGHSQGEIAAAVVAGGLSLEDGARVVALRSRAIRAIAGRGGMVSVPLPLAEVEELLRSWSGRVDVAAVNGPASVVVAGDADALDELMAYCESGDVRARRVPVDYASHTWHVEAIEEELARVLAAVEPRTGQVPFFSTTEAEFVDTARLDGGYWYRNLRRRVRFAEAVQGLVEQGYGAFVEVSSHPVLGMAVQEAAPDAVVVGTLRRDKGDAHRVLTSLAEAWVRGIPVDWTAVLAGHGARTVALPTYAFQHRRYWLETPDPALGSHSVDELDARFWEAVEREDLEALAGTLRVSDSGALAGVLPVLSGWRREQAVRSAVDGWRYKVAWQPVGRDIRSAGLSGVWLLVVPQGHPDTALVTALSDGLAAHGAEVRLLELTARHAESEALTSALDEASADLAVPFSGVLSLLGLDEDPLPDHPVLSTGAALTVSLLQALGRAGVGAPLWCVTQGAVAVGDQEPVARPAQAAVWGLGRVAALECPERWGGLVDLPERLDGRETGALCAVLASRGDSAEDQVALRAHGTFVRRLVPASLSASGNPGAGRRHWTPRGTALVTGGTGALGAHVARWLARGGAEDVVLVGRRDRSDDTALTELEAELADLGARLTVAACDVADSAALGELLSSLRADGRTVRTVVHAAGVGTLGTLADLSLAEFAEVAAGKVAGARHLTEALDPAETDALIFFSSISGVWGVADHAAYAAANACLDALAEQVRRTRGLPALSVAWGPWDGGGMIAEDMRDPLRRRGIPVIAAEPAMVALQEALDHGDTVVAVADVDWGRFVPVFSAARPAPLIAALAPKDETADGEGTRAGQRDGHGTDPAASTLAQRLGALPAVDHDRFVQDLVRSEAAAVLGHDSADAVDAAYAFKELGFDSVSAVELRNRLISRTGLRIPTTVVFDHPTPLALASHLRLLAVGDHAVPRQDSESLASVAASHTPLPDDDLIAVVGMGCRYPGGIASPDDLWRVVVDGEDVITGFPTDRGWDTTRLYDPDPDRNGTSYVRQGGFLHDAGEFDAAFFGISPREAAAMDPQQRLLLETSWEAFEQAGIDPRTLRGSSTGVFTGLTDQNYGTLLGRGADGTEGYLVTGASTAVASGRVSYVLGLEGPAVTVDTACSSSLVALHLGVRALRSGECSMALAGAAMVMADPAPFVGFSRQRGLAPDGRCKPFAEAADGFSLAEGVGVILLERLSDARRNGHPVLAVVRGSAINQDGASNGLTAPNGPAQQRVIRAALTDARLTAPEVDVVEAHGTGTRLGDPIEAQALLATYGQDRPADRPLFIGSLKSNIGHTQTASGMAGVMKMVLAMRHGLVPGTLHVDAPSSHVDWSAGAVSLLTEAVEWPSGEGRPRRAGVSSFGISGTNAHVVVEEAPVLSEAGSGHVDVAPVFVGGGVVPWVVSGRGGEGLAGQAGRLASVVGEARQVDVAWSLAATRTAFENRAVVLGGESAELVGGLHVLAAGGVVGSGVVRGAVVGGGDRVVFVFPGQGAQWVGMGRELWGVSPVFAASMEACERALAPFVGWSLSEVVRGGGELVDVDVVQPVSWAVMVSLAAVWAACGVVPSVVVGHSQGEIAAAVVAGGLSLEDGARVVALRSRAIRAIAGRGGMVSVPLPLAEVEELLTSWSGRVDVAAVNGPASVVVAGDADALDELMAHCGAEEIRARRVPVDYASHTWHVEAIEDELARVLAAVEPRSGEVPFFSTTEAEVVDTARLDGGYWYRNLRRRVCFADAVQGLVEQGYGAFVEVSSHPVLGMAVQEAAPDAVVVGTLRRDKGDAHRVLTSLAEAWVRGIPVDWTAVLAGQDARTVALPTYAFQHRRYWLETPEPAPGSHSVDEVDARFWEAVEREDLEALVDTLDLAPERRDTLDTVEPVLPVLAEWRRRRRESAALDSWRYAVTWRPAGASVAGPGPLASHWLVVLPGDDATAEDTAQELVEGLRGHGEVDDVVTVALDVTRADRAVLADRLHEAFERNPLIGGVLNLLPLAPRGDRPSAEPCPSGVPEAVTSTFLLMQALADTKADVPLWTVTRGAVGVLGPAAPQAASPLPEQAAVWGLGRVYGLDHPRRWGGLIDLPAPPGEEHAPGDVVVGLGARARDRFLTALAGDEDEDQFAVREDGLYVRRMVRKPVDTEAGERRTVGFTGTTLITGGTGALGAHLARRLAATGAGHLLLVSRRGPDAPGADGLERELTALGARVTIAACDITDREDLAELLSGVPEDAPVTAVVHAAGAEPPAVAIGDTDLDALHEVMRAKIAGALHLDALLGDRPLEAFVLFSSGAGIWGDGGHSGYAAANAYLDAFAEWRRGRGRTATSLAWGAWAGGGMVHAAEGDRLRRYGVPMMDPEVAVGAVQQALAHDETVLVVADVIWERFASTYSAARRRRLFDEIPEARLLDAAQVADRAAEADAGALPGPARSFADRLAGVSRAERERTVLQLVRTQVAAVLGHDGTGAIGPGHAFRDLGFDSLTAVELRNRLKEATGLGLPATLVFDHPTPAALGERLLSELAPQTSGTDAGDLSPLDALEAAVAVLDPGDDVSRTRITTRLQALLWRLSDGATETPVGGDPDDTLLEAVSDDEMFDLIDKELGLN
ncbi:type I polyketide synthase [Streptomyces sp. YKOK-I1]